MIAPEYIESDTYSFPIDVFAYGMLFYHVISNEMPMIPHGNICNLFFKILDGKLPKLDSIHPKYHNFLSSCWNKDQKLRPSFRNIIDLLTNKKNNLWLENVDDNEIKQYIHQFKS